MNLKAVTKNWAFVFVTINPLKRNDFYRRRAVGPLNCRMTYKDVANCQSLEEFCSLLTDKMQLLAMLQTLEGQVFFEMPECTPTTSSTSPQTPIYKLTHFVPAD